MLGLNVLDVHRLTVSRLERFFDISACSLFAAAAAAAAAAVSICTLLLLQRPRLRAHLLAAVLLISEPSARKHGLPTK